MLVLFLYLTLAADLSKPRELYFHTDYDSSLTLLRQIQNPDSEVYFLIGEARFHKADFKPASEAFEKACTLNPGNAKYHHALGRAYGRQAEVANSIMAPRYAIKTRQEFEKAVALDPTYVEAMNDLMEYYLEAPGFLGGGMSKAEDLAVKIAKLDEAEGHFARAQLAIHKKDSGTAERELREAMRAAPKQTGRILDLAKFLEKQGKVEESDQLYTKALQTDVHSALFARAEAYLRQNRNSGEAITLLERYLSMPLTPDDPPREAARQLLIKARPRNSQSH